MSTSRKVAVLAVFGLGAVALVAYIIRLALFVNITGIASGKIKDPNVNNDLLTLRSLFCSIIRSSSENYKMSQGNDNSQFKAEDQSLDSRKALVPESADSAEIETYAMGDVPKIDHGRRGGKDGIWVDKVV
ncbi:0ce53073-d442-4b93-9567-e78a924442e1 [Sclerotinia trifoliorum]|uniref:0ce53073-d442-4b93-9567-e78a924442e1 n=1 Tax=Sclerotinia trifoliorum TaxID=28548 RepID=A0A8H2VWE8_9HELO|nr:0ce53073-d442-4b93-9567-e78a924442e1 [Sclerotinia trifoliorum]